MNRIEIHISANNNNIGCSAIAEKLKRILSEIGFETILAPTFDNPYDDLFTIKQEEIPQGQIGHKSVDGALKHVIERDLTKIVIFDDGVNNHNSIIHSPHHGEKIHIDVSKMSVIGINAIREEIFLKGNIKNKDFILNWLNEGK